MNNLIRTVRSKSINHEQTQYQSEHESCVLCGTKLELKFEKIDCTKTEPSMVRETAECPRCTIRARSKDHRLQ